MSLESKQVFRTPLTTLFGVKHPIMLAGMNVAAGPDLAAAVSNAGGIGVIGGFQYTPKFLKKQIQILKRQLKDPNAPFGVDLLLPKVGDGARATNYDYTAGNLPELIDVVIQGGAKLFVSAVGVPPQWVVDKLHQHQILVMSMVGAPKHVPKCLSVGVDIICAQGHEGGGHTGDIATSVLLPAVLDLCKGRVSPLTGKPVMVIAAGGIYDGRGLAMSLALGCDGVWVGTRFVAAKEASAPPAHKQAVLDVKHGETFRTLVFTGRPLRIGPMPYARTWETKRSAKMKKLLAEGKVPATHDRDNAMAGQVPEEDLVHLLPLMKAAQKTGKRPHPWLMGQVAGSITDVQPAAQIIHEMVEGARTHINQASSFIIKARL
jgi:NAD(P)H-dependent flavin oxidoreductase YrpB (nitropropane dioxygenase family)